ILAIYIDLALAQHTIEKRVDMWQRIIGRELAQVLVAVENNQIVGFICFGQPKNYKNTQFYELSSIYLKPSHFNLGVGSQLYAECEKIMTLAKAKRITLWVLDGNQQALNFYQKMGFVATGEINKERADDIVLQDLQLAKQLC
ncbi:transcriptional regulator, partial [Catenovulum agarivorans DS-2]